MSAETWVDLHWPCFTATDEDQDCLLEDVRGHGLVRKRSKVKRTQIDLVRDPRLPHRVEVHRGVLAGDCAALLRSFFTPRRYTPERQGARVDEWGGLENR